VALTDELNRAFTPWVESLSSDEIAALRYYQGPNHKWINRVLRYPDVVLEPEQSRVVRKVTALVDSAIAKGRVPFKLRVFRGLRDYAALFNDLALDELVGERIHDPAFVSTSVAAHRADVFMDKDHGFRLEFDVQSGYPAAWLPLVGNPKMAGQRELLLPREIELVVIDKRIQEAILYVEGRLL
jgi:hypothetical protein